MKKMEEELIKVINENNELHNEIMLSENKPVFYLALFKNIKVTY